MVWGGRALQSRPSFVRASRRHGLAARALAYPGLDDRFKFCDTKSAVSWSRDAMHSVSSYFALAGLAVVTACSASSSPSGGGGTTNGCSCDLSYNGATRTISCGSDTCLKGVSFTCGTSAGVTQGGACTDTGSDAGTGSDSGSKTYQPGQCSQTTTGTVITSSGQCEFCVETNCCCVTVRART